MRCGACDVDLNENAAFCPLCGGPALDVPPRIAGVAFQDYPAYGRKPAPRIKPEKARFFRRNRSMTLEEDLRAKFHM